MNRARSGGNSACSRDVGELGYLTIGGTGPGGELDRFLASFGSVQLKRVRMVDPGLFLM